MAKYPELKAGTIPVNAYYVSQNYFGKENWDYLQAPIGRFASPEEMARAVLTLASDDMSFMVGQAVAVDGGLTTH
jgi:NAD(P)-dependent dehydrogenase (short-subunit alcohol dehydrogenase family)